MFLIESNQNERYSERDFIIFKIFNETNESISFRIQDRKKVLKLMKKYALQECRIELKDIMRDRTLKFNGFSVNLPVQPKRKYTCYQCWEKFFYAHELTKHKLIHKKEEEQKEKQKEAERHKQKSLKMHKHNQKKNPTEKSQSTVDNDKKSANAPAVNLNSPYRCETCNVNLSTVDDVKKHNNCKFYCGKCKRAFNTMPMFKIHILQHKINSVPPRQTKGHTCPDCSKVFFDIILLRNHTLLHHSTQQAKETLKPTSSVDVREEGSNVQTEDSNDLTCELCFDVFDNHKDYQEHMDFHKQLSNGDSNQNSELQESEITVPVIASSYSLAESQEIQDSPKDDETRFEVIKANDIIPKDHYKCKICFRMYMSLNEYDNHLIENCTLFKVCTECSKQVKGNIIFYNHVSKTHPKLFICEYCFEIVRGEKEIGDHRLLHFQSFKNVCRICYKIFKNYSAFSKHLNDHLNF